MQFETKVISNKKIAPEHYILSFKAPRIARMTKAGQFFNVRVHRSSEPLLRRPFGAHKIEKNKIELLYKVVGRATQILSTKKKGDTLDIIGPLGNGFSLEKPATGHRPEALLVAGGHGVAPLYELARQLRKRRQKTTLFIGAETKKDVICERDFTRLGVRVYVSTEDGSKGYKGLITDLLDRKAQSAKRKTQITIYACGPKPMLKAVAKIAKDHKIPCQSSLEEYIACGIGTCLGCAVKTRSGYKLVCKDGPIFDTKEIIW